MTSSGTFTGRRRERKTSWLVKFVDQASQWLICVGGIGTIVAVAFVCFVLASTTFNLFLPARLTPHPSTAAAWMKPDPLVRLFIDEYQQVGIAVTPAGQAVLVDLKRGVTLETVDLVPQRDQIRCLAIHPNSPQIAIGLDKGMVQVGELVLDVSTLDLSTVPEAERRALADLLEGETAGYQGGLVSRLPTGDLRWQRLKVELGVPFEVFSKDAVAIAALDFAQVGDDLRLVALDASGRLRMGALSTREDLLSGETVTEFEGSALPYEHNAERGLPQRVLADAIANSVFLIWSDGYCQRYDTRSVLRSALAEEIDLAPDERAKVTACEFMLGGKTLLVGDSNGRIQAWFLVRQDGTKTVDGARFTRAHDFPGSGKAVTAFAPSPVNFLFAAGYADGLMRIFHATTDRVVTESPAERAEPILGLAVGENTDETAIIALSPTSYRHWTLVTEHPEASAKGLFGKVWYEGAAGPEYVWQSGSDEPKFSLIPLIFGTLKATFYSLLFGVPVALLAAVYTSEFLSPRLKLTVKPSIEMMASLPSVVLGFLAGVVFASTVGRYLPTVLLFFVMIPYALLLAAHLWQLLPYKLGLHLARFRFFFILLALPIGGYAAILLGPAVEDWFFAGDVKSWLNDRKIGSGIGAWMFMWLPLSAMCTLAMSALVVTPWQRTLTRNWSREGCAWFQLGKFLVLTVVALGFAYGMSAFLTGALDWDPRGTFVGTYDNRNALLVGFTMGFAIIPIIYTIAEDSLSSVPEHLRSASLGAGATPWQTAVRVVIPTAMSGLFSAVMIGLGRAVGETMIVFMAAGNTPLLEMNLFNGFRTLSANLAEEIPEAVVASTHYRVLFLAALVLFAMTFVINTVAEVIRIRFRRKAYEL